MDADSQVSLAESAEPEPAPAPVTPVVDHPLCLRSPKTPPATPWEARATGSVEDKRPQEPISDLNTIVLSQTARLVRL